MWYYGEAGQTIGPVDGAEMARLRSSGRVNAATLVWRQGFDNWVPLGQTELGAVPPLMPPFQGPPGLAGGEAMPGAFARAGGRSGPPPGMGGGGPVWSAGPAGTVHFAGFWIRALAMLIDGVILEVLTIILARLLGYDLLIVGDTTLVYGVMQTPGSAIGLALGLVYFALIPAGRWQATPGKRLVGIHVIRADGQRLGAMAFLLRYLAYILSSLVFGLGFLMAGVTQQKRALHDFLCGTRVIYGRL